MKASDPPGFEIDVHPGNGGAPFGLHDEICALVEAGHGTSQRDQLSEPQCFQAEPAADIEHT